MPQPQQALAAPAPAYGYPPNDSAPSSSSPQTHQLGESEYKPPEFANGSIARSITRTPSPTQSELDLLSGVRRKRSWQEMIRQVLVLAIIVVVIALIEVYHDKIINALKPVTRWLHGLKGGWLIPIVAMIALSFPPLFGHEVIAMLCGLVWGLGPGFGIVVAGTLLGEIITFFFFRFFCGARGAKLELSNMNYGTLAHIVRKGGIVIAIITRYSALPAHFTTAVFATCGMPFWVFLIAAVVSLPKQFAIVYIGFALGTSGDTQSNKIQKIVLGITVVITVAAMVYIRRLMFTARADVVYARRKARQAKLEGSSPV